jgi:pimeloyl-ACP methyl ester carboxylesterase
MPAADSVGGAAAYRTQASYRIAPGLRPSETVLLLHGLGSDLSQLWDVPTHEAHPSQTLVATDARLHGHTVGFDTDELSFTAMAIDSFALLHAIAPSHRYSVIGVSMGAGTALKMVQLFPDCISKALLIRPAWTDTPDLGNLAPLTEIGYLLRERGPASGQEAFQSSATYHDLHRISPRAAASALSQFTRPHAVQRARRLIEMPANTPYDSPAALRRVCCRTTVIGALDDPMHPLSIAEEWASHLTGATLEVLPNRDHDSRLFDKVQSDVVDRFIRNGE